MSESILEVRKCHCRHYVGLGLPVPRAPASSKSVIKNETSTVRSRAGVEGWGVILVWRPSF